MACASPNVIIQKKLSGNIKFVGKKTFDSHINKNEWFIRHEVPCQKCMSCRVAKKSEWAARILLEASCHPQNCSITLTYENAPEQLEHRDWQLFIKRLRKHLDPKKISFFMAGEYGEIKMRPHIHAILFNHTFDDLEYVSTNSKGNQIFTSKILTEIWGKGFTQVGPVNFDTAAYCASYVTKKIDGAIADDYYKGKKPEYAVASKGVGLSWLKKYPGDAESGTLKLSDRSLPVPRYFNKKLKEFDSEKHQRITDKRVVDGINKNNRMLDKGLEPLKLSSYKAEILRRKHILGGKNEI